MPTDPATTDEPAEQEDPIEDRFDGAPYDDVLDADGVPYEPVDIDEI